MRLPIGFLLLACLAAPALPARAQADGSSLRAEIHRVRDQVYPALVNLTVVSRSYSGGRARRSLAGGSGVIVTPEGHVLTNYHVASDALRITGVLPDGSTYDAEVVAHDPFTDLSVLKLQGGGRPFPHARLGDSSKLEVGDYVVAMGNPLMLSSSITLGVVSNPHRVFTDVTGSDLQDLDLSTGEKTGLFTRWIQHDALILPGNSGGPLVNLEGAVVGINELGGSGVGFAIPSNIARQVLDHVLQFGEVRRGWLGFTILPVDKLGRAEGALVSSVFPGDPADQAGLKAGDLLLSLDGQPVKVRYFEEIPLLYQQVAALPAGRKVELKVSRGGQERTLQATVDAMRNFAGEEREFRDYGITAQEITDALALFYSLGRTDGVWVTGVRAGYPFESARPALSPGDIILAIDGRPVGSLESFGKALEAMGKGKHTVNFLREGEDLVTRVEVREEAPAARNLELPRPWMGVRTQVLTPEVAEAVGAPQASGFRVTLVYPGTEAARAGLKPGDLILALDGSPLAASRQQDSQDLRQLLEHRSVGETVELSVQRDGKPLALRVVLERVPEAREDAQSASSDPLEFSVRDLTDMDRLDKRLPANLQGVLVTEVEAGGWAQVAGLHVGDLLITVAGRPVTGVEGFRALMADLQRQKPEVVPLFVRRGYRTHFVFLEPNWR